MDLNIPKDKGGYPLDAVQCDDGGVQGCKT